MKKVLITGGSGFIGTNLINYISHAFPSAQILSLDIVPPRDSSHAHFYVRCDVNNLSSLSFLVHEYDPSHIFHLAAATGVGDLPLDLFKTNFDGVANLIESVKDLQHLERVVFASSLLVCKVGFIPESFDEYCPSTSYGISKMKGEILVKRSCSSVDWVIVRPISIWGPWNQEPYLQFFQSVLNYFYFNIGNFSSFRSLGFVGNTVYQLCRIATANRDLVSGRIFYLADYNPLSLRVMAQRIASYRSLCSFIPSLPLPFVRFLAIVGDLLQKSGVPFPLSSFRLNNLLVEYIFDLSSLSEICGSLPFSPDQGIQITVDFLRNNHPTPFRTKRGKSSAYDYFRSK